MVNAFALMAAIFGAKAVVTVYIAWTAAAIYPAWGDVALITICLPNHHNADLPTDNYLSV
jgi:hypothetical protein